jgi:predicted dehydrogenase
MAKRTRREFLQLAAGTGIATAIAGAGVSASDVHAQTNDKVGWAIVGLGNYAQYAMERFASARRSFISGLVSGDPEKAKRFAGRFGVRPESIFDYSTFDRIANDRATEVVYIVTPNSLHADFAIRAMDAGKHVIVEKTMAATSKDALRMIETSKRTGKKLMVAYRARFDPYNQAAIRMAKEEEFGKITAIAAHKGFVIGENLGKDRWRTKRSMIGGGALVDIGVYSIQACRYIAGQDPVEVSAISQSTPNDPRFAEVEENISFSLRFPNGILATGSASWNYSLQNYYRVVGTKGWYELDPATSNANLRMYASTERAPRQGQPSRVVEERTFPNVDQLPVMFDHFSECVRTGAQPLIPIDDGLRDLEVIEAAYESARTGRTVKIAYATI